MKFSNALCCVIFIFLFKNDAVLRTFSSSQNFTVGVIQRKNVYAQWTGKALLENALKQLTVDNIFNETVNFNFEYFNELNLSSVGECFDFLCGSLASVNLYALVTTYGSVDSQVLTQWSGLAGMHVIGASRSSALKNQRKYPNYNYLFPSLSEEMLVLHSILDAVNMDQFAFLRGGDQDSIDVLSSFVSRFTQPIHRKYVLFNLTQNRETVKAQAINFLESIRSLSIKVIVLVCNEEDTEQILQASLEAGLLGNDSLWIGTERAVSYVNRAPGQYLPSNMIGIQLQVIPEKTALRAAAILLNISRQDDLTSTAAHLCTRRSYTYCDLRPTVSTPPNNNTYNILQRYQNTSDVSGTRFHVTTQWSSLSGLSKNKDLYNKYHLFSSKMQRIRIVTIEHGQYTYQVSKTFPKCTLGLDFCEPQDQTCEIGIPATRYNKTSNGTYKSARICIAGLMVQLLYLFKSELNFEYDLYIVKDGKYGGLVDAGKGTWNGMIGDILAGEADMALATLTTTRERSKFVDFSYPYGEVGIGLLTAASADGQQTQINMDFIHPFTLWLWTVILSSIAVVWTLIWILDKVSFTWYLKNRYARIFKKRIYFLESMSFVWSTFVHIPAGSGLPRSESSRFVALFFALAMVIVSASYTAELAARKVKQEVTAPITGIFDDKMLNPPEGFKYGTLKDSSTEAFFKHSEDPRLRQIYRNMKDNNVMRVENGVKKLVTGEFKVYIDDRPYLEHLVSSRLNCSLRVVGDSLGTSGYAVALKKNSKWTKPLSLAILKYNENNVLQDLWEKWLKRKCISKDEFGKEPSGLATGDLNGLFLAVLVGIGLGILALGIENSIDYLRENRRTAVAITDSNGNNNRDVDGVAMETSTSVVRLVSHFNNSGFEDIAMGRDSDVVTRTGEIVRR